MGEPDLGPVHGTIAGCLDEGQIIGILRIEDNVIDCLLFHVNRGQLTRSRRDTLTASMTGRLGSSAHGADGKGVVLVCRGGHFLRCGEKQWAEKKSQFHKEQ